MSGVVRSSRGRHHVDAAVAGHPAVAELSVQLSRHHLPGRLDALRQIAGLDAQHVAGRVEPALGERRSPEFAAAVGRSTRPPSIRARP